MAAETVTIACKLPAGLKMQVFDMQPHFEPVMGGGMRETKIGQPGESVMIKGTKRLDDDPRLFNGYALTYNVDKAFWDRWLAANKDADIVTKKIVFAQSRPADAQSQAREQEKIKTGLDPIDPDDLPREFKGKIATAERK